MATLDTPGSIARHQRWLAAGSPRADLARLAFVGDDSVRVAVVDVVLAAPDDVAWHAVEFVTWFEVGRRAHAVSGIAPAMRAPDDGDRAHMILIAGASIDEAKLRGAIAHELAHSYTRAVYPFSERLITREQLIDEQIADEVLADQLATRWGFPRDTNVELLTQLFHADLETGRI